MVHFKINGQPMEASPGTTIIEAAHRAGIDVPHFCYHPGLAPEGNCRMCLVEVTNSRKPVASCITPVAEEMEVLTDSPQAEEARKGVLELMLINHPLDCPICDKSGECMLQDNTYDHGPDNSRMVELKELKPTKDLGSKISLWGNRCIVCTRCVRFCHEVSGTGELTIVNRGDHSVVDVFEDYPLENPLAMNTVDICPVGALISKDFLYEARVWYLNKKNSICSGCATGCNIEVETLRNDIKRLMPRHNSEVNDFWMCDYGRFDFRYVGDDSRLYQYHLVSKNGKEISRNVKDASSNVLGGLRHIINAHGEDAIAGIGSAFMTLEELQCFKNIFEKLGSSNLAAHARPRLADEQFPKFVISGDKNPNRAGVDHILGSDALDDIKLDKIKEGIQSGKIRALLMVSDLPHQPLDDEWIDLLGKLDFAAIFLLQTDSRFESNTGLLSKISLLPATTFAEKTGTFINVDQRLQRLQTAVQPPRNVSPEINIFQEILVALGEQNEVLSPASVFKKIGKRDIPELDGKTHRDVGDLGIHLEKSDSRKKKASTKTN